MPKFNKEDRDKVIAAVEKHLGVKLSRVGKREKFLQDGSGKSYWVLGGYDDWHGIPSDMLQEELRRVIDGVLVIAKRYRSTIDIFTGSLGTLVSSGHKLSHARDGGYRFHVDPRGNFLTVKEIPGLTLRKLGASLEVGPAVSPQVKETEAMLAKLSPEEQLQLLRQHLSGKSGDSN